MTSYLSSLNLNQQKRRFLLVDFPTLHFFWVPFVYSKVLQFCFFFLFLYYPISFDCHRLRQPNFRRQFLARQRRMGRRPRRSPPELFRIFRSFFSFGFVSFFIVRSFVGRSLSSPFFFYVGSSSVSSFLTKAPSHVATLPRLAYSFYWVFTGFSFQLEFQVRCSAKKKIFFFCFRKRLYWLLLGFQSIFLI